MFSIGIVITEFFKEPTILKLIPIIPLGIMLYTSYVKYESAISLEAHKQQ